MITKKNIALISINIILGIVFIIQINSLNTSNVNAEQFDSTSEERKNLDETARSALPLELEAIRGDQQNYGFTDESELSKAVLGDPYQVLFLDVDKIDKYDSAKKIADTIIEYYWWEYPILVDGKARGILSLAQVQGKWKVVRYGGLTASQKIIDFQSNKKNTAKGIKILRIVPLHTTLGIVEHDDNESLTMISTISNQFANIDKSQFKEYSTDSFIGYIKDEIRKQKDN